jgi:hypothetical protein
MAIETKLRISADDIDFDSMEEQDALLNQVLALGNARFAEEFKRAVELGIIDEKGNLLDKTLPPDMQEGSGTDFGG